MSAHRNGIPRLTRVLHGFQVAARQVVVLELLDVSGGYQKQPPRRLLPLVKEDHSVFADSDSQTRGKRIDGGGP
jgi:hypothetical protein